MRWQVILMAILFLPCSIMDIRTKRLPVWFMLVIALLAIIGNLWLENVLWNTLAGAALGVLLLVIHLFAKTSIGAGDGILVVAIGCAIGFWETISTLLIALSLAAIVGLVCLFVLHKKKQLALPFAPFLAVGYMVIILFR